jgi:hypothetical protein
MQLALCHRHHQVPAFFLCRHHRPEASRNHGNNAWLAGWQALQRIKPLNSLKDSYALPGMALT